MSEVIGREQEKSLLNRILNSKQAELIAVYGRRRVGKTYLIREYVFPKAQFYFSVTGKKDGKMKDELNIFQVEMEKKFFSGARLPPLKNWQEAFELLAMQIEQMCEQKKFKNIVVFLDELPWLTTPRSGLLQALDHIWNTRLSRLPQVKFITCGSAASWMIDNLIHATGGLHNRLTARMRIEPFSLKEAQEFLKYKGIILKEVQVLELYLAIGGVPYYLNHVQPGHSAAWNIGELCFGKNGALRDEFHQLFKSLFNESDLYEYIVRCLSKKREGLTKDELSKQAKLSNGGRLGERLRELEEAGFVIGLTPYGKKTKDTRYQIIDEYVWFYFKWIEPAPKGGLAGKASAYWTSLSTTPSYLAWAGYAFEGLCLKHAPLVQKALGYGGVPVQTGTWSFIPKKRDINEKGAQIDLLFDAGDKSITLCELKYSNSDYVIDKKYAEELKNKISVFEEKTRTKKQIFFALVTTHGLKENAWSKDLITKVVTLKSLFQ